MKEGQMMIFQGEKIEILEMTLKSADDRPELSWIISLKSAVYRMTFYNVSRFRIGYISMPFEVQGFEIIDNSKNGWGKDSAYEIRDFEDDRVNFFCEYFKIDELPRQ